MEQIIIGVDTHKSEHVAVAITSQGAHVASTTIPATREGYRGLEAWAVALGSVEAFGIEGTGSYQHAACEACAVRAVQGGCQQGRGQPRLAQGEGGLGRLVRPQPG